MRLTVLAMALLPFLSHAQDQLKGDHQFAAGVALGTVDGLSLLYENPSSSLIEFLLALEKAQPFVSVDACKEIPPSHTTPEMTPYLCLGIYGFQSDHQQTNRSYKQLLNSQTRNEKVSFFGGLKLAAGIRVTLPQTRVSVSFDIAPAIGLYPKYKPDIYSRVSVRFTIL